jgi:hypothetical protein
MDPPLDILASGRSSFFAPPEALLFPRMLHSHDSFYITAFYFHSQPVLTVSCSELSETVAIAHCAYQGTPAAETERLCSTQASRRVLRYFACIMNRDVHSVHTEQC